MRRFAWLALALVASIPIGCTVIGGLGGDYRACPKGEHPTATGCVSGDGGGSSSGSSSSSSGAPCTDTCDGKCADTLTDVNNCGKCGSVCELGDTCVEGKCSCSTGVFCASGCVDLKTNADNCNACGAPCDYGAVCDNGGCGCPGTTTSCHCADYDAGAPGCQDSCADLDTDPKNCGMCGRACADSEACKDGVCQCAGTTCGGVCVNTKADPDNCGTCGKACAADESCVASRCLAPTKVTPDLDGTPIALTSDATTLYWVSQDNPNASLHSIPKSGGSNVATLAAGFPDSRFLTRDSQGVFYIGTREDKAQILTTKGGDATTMPAVLADTIGGLSGLVVDGTSLFWSADDDGTVSRMDMSAPGAKGPVTVIADMEMRATDVKVDAHNIYWARAYGGPIRQAPRAGGMPSDITVKSLPDDVLSVTVDGTTVYWGSNAGNVTAVHIGGGAIHSVAYQPTGGTEVDRMKVSNNYLYWVEEDGHRLLRVPVAGGPVEVLGRKLSAPHDLVVDGSDIYFTTNSGIYKLSVD